MLLYRIAHKSFSSELFAPSAVLPDAFNYVLNSLHPDFLRIKLLRVTPLIPDERIEDLLKSD